MKPFRPSSLVKQVSVTGSNQAVAIPVPTASNPNHHQNPGYTLRVCVQPEADLYLKWGFDNTVAATTADGGYHVRIPAGSVELIAFPPQILNATGDLVPVTYMGLIGGGAVVCDFTRGEGA